MSKKMWIGGTIGALLVIGMIGTSIDGDDATVSEAAPVSSEVGAEIGTEPTTPEPTTEPAPATETVTAPAPAAETVTEEVVVTETAEVTVTEAAPAPEPAPEPEPEVSDEEINDLALELVWGSLSSLEQDDFCWGWDYDQEMMVDSFMEGAGDAYPRAKVVSFFSGVC